MLFKFQLSTTQKFDNLFGLEAGGVFFFPPMMREGEVDKGNQWRKERRDKEINFTASLLLFECHISFSRKFYCISKVCASGLRGRI